ncbi:MAG: hypothetical protein K8L99_22195 [Anaerolineae bacterium]|nr:hypothetical protein [Anaerolineae bacterium]
MTKDKKTIYVLVQCPPDGRDPHQEWDVIQWQDHPALAPHSGGKRTVSTAAGDVELRVPPLADRNYKVLGWASQRIEQLHPRPAMLELEPMSDEALLREVLQLSMEYIALAEDGRGHNSRSRFIARQLREIQQHKNQQLSTIVN